MGAHTIAGGRLKWEQGAEPSWPPHFNHCIQIGRNLWEWRPSNLFSTHNGGRSLPSGPTEFLHRVQWVGLAVSNEFLQRRQQVGAVFIH